MDIAKTVENLRAERNKLNGIIEVLERLQSGEVAAAPKRRGRKFMDRAGREEVSERMKRYWAGRRASQGKTKEHADGASASGEQKQFAGLQRAQVFAA